MSENKTEEKKYVCDHRIKIIEDEMRGALVIRDGPYYLSNVRLDKNGEKIGYCMICGTISVDSFSVSSDN